MQTLRLRPALEDIPYGFCHCGCGERTAISPKSLTKLGVVRGEPRRFIKHHLRRFYDLDYVIEDGPLSTCCWIWTRCRNVWGYGSLRLKGKTVLAHRVYFELANGPIPRGFVLDHLCRNRACVNPEHLEVVTFSENVRRGENAKLTAQQVERIRLDTSASATAFAKLFDVSADHVREIRKGAKWK